MLHASYVYQVMFGFALSKWWQILTWESYKGNSELDVEKDTGATPQNIR